MAATGSDVERWIVTAKKDKMKYIISVCDTFDYDDYPVYCKNEQELNKKTGEYNHKNMQSINEIINIDDFKVDKKGTVTRIKKK